MKIRIRSFDAYNEKYCRDFEIKRTVFDGERNEYHYEDDYGKCRISKGEEELVIYRQGAINSKQVFKVGRRTSFIYITDNFKGKYEIFTKKKIINNGKVLVEYDIMDGNEIINSIELEILIL